MRHEHKELIRDEMHSTNKYCHDLASLSIADIYALIEYNTKIIGEAGENAKYAPFSNNNQNLRELSEYMNEFNVRLANRTVGPNSNINLNKRS
jgi:hypothetical protein